MTVWASERVWTKQTSWERKKKYSFGKKSKVSKVANLFLFILNLQNSCYLRSNEASRPGLSKASSKSKPNGIVWKLRLMTVDERIKHCIILSKIHKRYSRRLVTHLQLVNSPSLRGWRLSRSLFPIRFEDSQAAWFACYGRFPNTLSNYIGCVRFDSIAEYIIKP